MEARLRSSGCWDGFWKRRQADVLFEAAEAMFVRASSQRHSKRIPQLQFVTSTITMHIDIDYQSKLL